MKLVKLVSPARAPFKTKHARTVLIALLLSLAGSLCTGWQKQAIPLPAQSSKKKTGWARRPSNCPPCPMSQKRWVLLAPARSSGARRSRRRWRQCNASRSDEVTYYCAHDISLFLYYTCTPSSTHLRVGSAPLRQPLVVKHICVRRVHSAQFDHADPLVVVRVPLAVAHIATVGSVVPAIQRAHVVRNCRRAKLCKRCMQLCVGGSVGAELTCVESVTELGPLGSGGPGGEVRPHVKSLAKPHLPQTEGGSGFIRMESLHGLLCSRRRSVAAAHNTPAHAQHAGRPRGDTVAGGEQYQVGELAVLLEALQMDHECRRQPAKRQRLLLRRELPNIAPPSGHRSVGSPGT